VNSLELGSVTIQARLGSARLLYKFTRLDSVTVQARLDSSSAKLDSARIFKRQNETKKPSFKRQNETKKPSYIYIYNHHFTVTAAYTGKRTGKIKKVFLHNQCNQELHFHSRDHQIVLVNFNHSLNHLNIYIYIYIYIYISKKIYLPSDHSQYFIIIFVWGGGG
jgi:hypothetical protein